ncbi:PilZ domain-containing protein [Caulobacter mirabilis]|uniref:Pilus assembly protein PilZ n=1 Tax=Caulobacter mirabilis TaxID=69666 RepID=A0A2D2AW34_9CAUL|nr:pilus assembly protein PilZ [Caulobacter mirabilis]
MSVVPFAPRPVPSSSGVQRRGGVRHRSLLAAKLTNADASATIDCTIRNLSEEGAQIETASLQLLPQPAPLRLMQIKDGVAWDVEIAWRRGNRMGLRLTRRHDLHGAVEADLRALRAIWSQMALR